MGYYSNRLHPSPPFYFACHWHILKTRQPIELALPKIPKTQHVHQYIKRLFQIKMPINSNAFSMSIVTIPKYKQCCNSPQITLMIITCLGILISTNTIIIIIMVIFMCYFSGEHIALSIKIQQRCEHRISKNQQIKSTVHDAN